jgi:hypothetical protein
VRRFEGALAPGCARPGTGPRRCACQCREVPRDCVQRFKSNPRQAPSMTWSRASEVTSVAILGGAGQRRPSDCLRAAHRARPRARHAHGSRKRASSAPRGLGSSPRRHRPHDRAPSESHWHEHRCAAPRETPKVDQTGIEATDPGGNHGRANCSITHRKAPSIRHPAILWRVTTRSSRHSVRISDCVARRTSILGPQHAGIGCVNSLLRRNLGSISPTDDGGNLHFWDARARYANLGRSGHALPLSGPFARRVNLDSKRLVVASVSGTHAAAGAVSE